MKTSTFTLILVATMLASCSSTPTPPSKKPTAKPASSSEQFTFRPRPVASADSEFNPATVDLKTVEQWLIDAKSSEPEEAAELLLRSAEVLLREGELARADDVVGELIAPELNADQALRLAIIRARVQRGHAEFSQALAQLSDPLIESAVLEAPVRRQMQYSQLRASLYEIEGDYLSAARERIFIDPMLSPGQQPSNRESIWGALMQIPTSMLVKNINSSTNRDYIGWLELASIAKDNQNNIDAQVKQRDAWLRNWPQHPAHDALPGGLDKLNDLIVERADQVALILPVTGRLAAYGKAIRDGFFAAYYETLNQGGSVPQINQYDSNATDINTLYQDVLNSGNKLVIGPLEKENLSALVANHPSSMNVPTLALNRIDGNRFPNGLYQFGLNPEDEAEQIAEIAMSKGYSRALILTPEGSWGQKVAAAFAQRWQDLNGKIVASQTFDASKNNYSERIKSILQIDKSQQRLQRLQQIIGFRPTYEPYRRSDIDFIFLLARPNEGRAIKPLLAYHYAGDIPVYATSHIYRGSNSPGKDQDINGVRFIDIPWIFNQKSAIRRDINAGIPSSAGYQRMYALGVDSFRLHLRLKQLRNGASGQVFGETGTLTLNELGQIERELSLAEIQDGVAVVNPLGAANQDVSNDF
ncbi:MAG: penicillin-binding protein activator [Gammaproteobacteria bacterium]|uniref:penicillin-binding protein activator n=1 Tax=Zhongshania sp. TaxID=1971902 RepID=UPI001B70C74F|nr:penicillin-binding protein activator [Zhongshania sp.]MBQ0759001.1 penicillin-binding protein activator [Zhongshania sp.]MBQ0794354.1 penicillin-binding protein activator [Zhongshania sp.]MBU0538106.1 penicillin-binding protein activator [Gammaproteobacteria bacterium]MBU1831980.1 penicillin-binding protein activator [Gammaproteobacteria bacterium]